MKVERRRAGIILAACVIAAGSLADCTTPPAGPFAARDPLPSWNDGAAKASITSFVTRVTAAQGSADFVAPAERIAVFDNDGTLWSEAPLPFQAAFVFDELERRRGSEPALAADPMVRAALAGDLATLLAGAHHDGLMHVLGLTHAGMTTEAFAARVGSWLETARHPRFKRRYDELTYQPMQELLAYLRATGFKTFIVSGGGADFMRVWTDRVYGIPPEQVVGSTALTRYELRDGQPALIKTLNQVFVDDREGKPVGIHQFIGRRPIVAVGNSDGDQAMIEYTTLGNPRPSLGMLVHHTDGEREYAYDTDPPGSGTLTSALSAAREHGWTVVDMLRDWNAMFGPRPGTD